MTDWLDGDEQATWRAYLTVTKLLPDRLAVNLGRDHGLTMNDYEILVVLSEAPDQRLRMTELSEATLLSKSRLSHQITRMERAKLVERVDCPTDRRGAYAVLTPTGWERIKQAAPVHVDDVRTHFLNLLSHDELDLLRKGLARVADHLQQERTVRINP
jgi:DNA-binding MarR family transcriptional regulator